MGKSYFNILQSHNIVLSGWTDANYEKLGYPYRSIDMVSFDDTVVIAIENDEIANLVKEMYVLKGIPEKQIYWERPLRI